jgi:hypothetical protein
LSTNFNISSALLYTLLSNGFYPPPGEGPCRKAGVDGIAPAFAGKYGDLGSTINPKEDPWDDMEWFPTFKRYSKELRRLAMECLTWKPNERPTLLSMRTSIDDFLLTNPDVADDRNIESLVVGKEKKFRIGNKF